MILPTTINATFLKRKKHLENVYSLVIFNFNYWWQQQPTAPLIIVRENCNLQARKNK